jgi:hypothetical protein
MPGGGNTTTPAVAARAPNHSGLEDVPAPTSPGLDDPTRATIPRAAQRSRRYSAFRQPIRRRESSGLDPGVSRSACYTPDLGGRPLAGFAGALEQALVLGDVQHDRLRPVAKENDEAPS